MRYLLTIVLLSSLFTSSAQEFMGGEIYFDRIDETHADVYVDIYYKAPSNYDAPNIELDLYGFFTHDLAWYEKHVLSKGLVLFRYTVEGTFFLEGILPVTVTNQFILENIINYEGSNVFHLYSNYYNSLLTNMVNLNLPYFNNRHDTYFIQDGILYYLLEAVNTDSFDEVRFYFEPQYTSASENIPDFTFHLPEASDTLTLDNETGLLIWERPLVPGKYFLPFSLVELYLGTAPDGEVKRFQIIEITEEDIVTSYQSAPSSITGQIKLYPNPVRELLTIELENIDQVNPLPFRIIDSKGIAIHTGRIDADKMQISTQEWASGMYYLVITTGEKFPVVRKIVVD